jgi:hypothetical protein
MSETEPINLRASCHNLCFRKVECMDSQDRTGAINGRIERESGNKSYKEDTVRQCLKKREIQFHEVDKGNYALILKGPSTK